MLKPISKKVLKTKPCARDEKQAVHQVLVGTEWIPLCSSCAVAWQRRMLEFLDVEDVDGKLLEFRESF